MSRTPERVRERCVCVCVRERERERESDVTGVHVQAERGTPGDWERMKI
jgi:hypothetical protein